MSRKPIPLEVSDTSAFAKSLRLQLVAFEGLPSHLQLLNMLARAAGYGNFQSLRAKTDPAGSEAQPPTPAPVVDAAIDRKHIDRVQRSFDEELRLMRWPSRRMDQITALWLLWSRIPAAREMPEKEVNALLRDRHLFGDHALLRRELCELGLMRRTRDGSVYRRVEQPMPINAATILSQRSSRQAH
ncbi:DUF2087 domain-containing protein [Rhizobium sp. MC63]|uniref:DUF2087 domain-containing protein n=2 Tax=Rhizobium TaxID=379 RepID=A0A7W8XK55_9HYPH|nr:MULTISPECIES: DUF2087 domain-containing protein [Rhizobium]MBB4577200.1 hypothetical protein [Rhizobium lentis]MBB5553763.1 hypothetical protein [Rhizobium lentis]MBB5564265.1 hypothetical protein [Rhizobium lentis]MBB5570809.1 hypothetical protein [Rhizobium lentis]MDF0698639.1 DUF2087 domain-containing protein [Rhizobium sp. MC63]